MRPWLKSALAASISPTLVLSLAFSGCDSSGPSTEPPLPPVIDTLVAGLADAACDWQARCCSPIELEEGEGFANKTECVSHATLGLQKATASLSFAMADSLIILDASATMECIAQQRARVCNTADMPGSTSEALDFARWLQPCLSAFRGQVRAGGRCVHPGECIEGTHCASVPLVGTAPNPDGGLVSQSDTICLPDQKRGDACLTDDDCDHSHNDYCQLPDRHCAGRVAEGGKCGYVTAPDEVGFPNAIPSPACARGLLCNANGVCAAPSRQGEQCAPFTEGSCDPDPTLDLSCVSASFNSLAGTCEPAGKTGDPCGDSGLPPCKGGLACNRGGQRGLGICGPPPKTGEPCSLDDTCESPARCYSATQACTAPGDSATGEACASDTDCVSLNCSNTPTGGVCAVGQALLISCSGAAANAGRIGGFNSVDGGPIIIFDASADRPGSGSTDAFPLPVDGTSLPFPVDAGVADAANNDGMGH